MPDTTMSRFDRLEFSFLHFATAFESCPRFLEMTWQFDYHIASVQTLESVVKNCGLKTHFSLVLLCSVAGKNRS